MSATQQQTQVTLDKLILTFEDLAKIDAILGNLPYKTVKPIYDIINGRALEQGEAKLKGIQAETQKSPAQEPIPEEATLRDKE